MNASAGAALLAAMGVVLASILPARAASQGELIEETWESASVEGARIGYLHTHVRRLDDGKRLRATAELDLTFQRHNATLHLRREHGSEETPDGKILGVFMRQGQDGGRQLVLSGVVEDGRLHVRVDNGRIERRIPWNEDAVGLYRLGHLFAQRRPKPGDRFTLHRYEPTYNTLLTVHVAVREREAGLLRVEMTADKLTAPGVSVQPPAEVWWLDAQFAPVRRQIELDGLGAVVLTRTSRAAALAPAAPGRVADIGLKTLLPLNRTIPRPYTTRSVVYHITLHGDSEPGSALAQDEHQDIRDLRGESFELHVHPVRRAARRDNAPAAAEYLESCPFINSDDARVKELARRAAGSETDPWARARRLERWVKQSMRPDNTVALGPAGDVARQLRGDCRQYALLTAALCRAEGIPARTAVGLLYVEKTRRPMMGFHMWTEVCIDGQWRGLDATLGLGGVSAVHLKIADHSWHAVQSLTPLLPATRLLGKIAVRVVSVEGSE